MDKNIIGLLIVVILAILQVFGWITGHNGIMTATILSIITGIAGAIFGFKIGLNKTPPS